MKLRVRLKKGRSLVTTDIEVKCKTLMELIKNKIVLDILKDDLIEFYRDEGYYLKGVEDIDVYSPTKTNE